MIYTNPQTYSATSLEDQFLEKKYQYDDSEEDGRMIAIGSQSSKSLIHNRIQVKSERSKNNGNNWKNSSDMDDKERLEEDEEFDRKFGGCGTLQKRHRRY